MRANERVKKSKQSIEFNCVYHFHLPDDGSQREVCEEEPDNLPFITHIPLPAVIHGHGQVDDVGEHYEGEREAAVDIVPRLQERHRQLDVGDHVHDVQAGQGSLERRVVPFEDLLLITLRLRFLGADVEGAAGTGVADGGVEAFQQSWLGVVNIDSCLRLYFGCCAGVGFIQQLRLIVLARVLLGVTMVYKNS